MFRVGEWGGVYGVYEVEDGKVFEDEEDFVVGVESIFGESFRGFSGGR